MKKILLFLSVVSFCHGSLPAQIPDDDVFQNFRTLVNDVFSEIPSSKISTGILNERSVGLINLLDYEGTDTSKICNTDDWLDIYYQLYLGHLNYEDFDFQEEFPNLIPLEYEADLDIPIGLIFYDYNRINPFAVMEGKIIVDTVNNKIIDASNPGENPFLVSSCFASTSLIDTIPVGSYNFYISDEFLVSNKIAEIDELLIDFDDGLGFISTSIGTNNFISYNNSGQKYIQIKAIIDNETFYSYSDLTVVDEIQDKDWGIRVIPDAGPFEFDEAGIKAEYGIYYRCNGDGSIRKPYIIVSGFDPEDKNRTGEEFKYIPPPFDQTIKLDKINLYKVANKDGFLDKLRDDGFDIIIYRSKQSTESIISNANNLIEFIKKINNEKTSDNELIIAGASMGGLVCRYALRSMEVQGIDHQTKLFISVDSPQNGANVPLGIQYLVKYLDLDLKPFSSIITKVKDAKEKMLDSDAAQQMLLYHYSNTSGTKANCSGLRDIFIQELNSIGNFPKNCRSIGISMGSGIGIEQGFDPGELLLQKKPSFLAGDLMQAGTMLRWEFNVFAVPDEFPWPIFTESLSVQMLIPVAVPCVCPGLFRIEFIAIQISPDIVHRNVIVDNTISMDNAPGSIQNLHNTKAFKGNKEVLGVELRDLISFLGLAYIEPSSDCFIPSFSSLGLNSVTPHQRIKYYLRNNPDVFTVSDNHYVNLGGDDISLFDVMYIENKNDNHIYDENKEGVFSEGMLELMHNETSPDDLYIENKTISYGQSISYEARNNIFVGENVDGYTFNDGPVLLENGGSLTLSAQDIALYPGFICEEGGELNIIPNSITFCEPGQTFTPKSTEVDGSSYGMDINSNSNAISASDKPFLSKLIDEYSEPILFYPNPADDKIFISSNKEINDLYIYDIMGNEISYQKFYRKTEVDISRLKPGNYYLKIIQENGHITTKQFIKN